MALSETKQKILDAALQLFNETGISNTRLQQIADETGISIGNLAYHYPNKEAIAESLIGNLIVSLEELLGTYGRYDPLNDLNFFFAAYYRLSTQYAFFNCDILEIKRNFPSSHELLLAPFHQVKLQLEGRFDLCLQQQLFKKSADIKAIALNTWLLMFYMPAEERAEGLRTTNGEHPFRRRLWEVIMPYFTEKGSAEYGELSSRV